MAVGRTCLFRAARIGTGVAYRWLRFVGVVGSIDFRGPCLASSIYAIHLSSWNMFDFIGLYDSLTLFGFIYLYHSPVVLEHVWLHRSIWQSDPVWLRLSIPFSCRLGTCLTSSVYMTVWPCLALSIYAIRLSFWNMFDFIGLYDSLTLFGFVYLCHSPAFWNMFDFIGLSMPCVLCFVCTQAEEGRRRSSLSDERAPADATLECIRQKRALGWGR
jgi:hypothetical protein